VTATGGIFKIDAHAPRRPTAAFIHEQQAVALVAAAHYVTPRWPVTKNGPTRRHRSVRPAALCSGRRASDVPLSYCAKGLIRVSFPSPPRRHLLLLSSFFSPRITANRRAVAFFFKLYYHRMFRAAFPEWWSAEPWGSVKEP